MFGEKRILLGAAIGAAVVAYLVYKNKKAAKNETITPNEDIKKSGGTFGNTFGNVAIYDASKDELGINSLVRVKGERDSDIDPYLMKMAAQGGSQQYTYKDKNGGIIMQYIDTNGVVTYAKTEKVSSGGENNYEYDRNGILIRKWFFNGIYF